MRSALVLVLLALAVPRDAEACFDAGFEQHHLDRSQLADTVQPGPVSVSMWIEEGDGGGCVAPSTRSSRCTQTGRRLVVMVSSNDDQTPPDKLGYRVTVSAGTAPFPDPGDVRPIDDQFSFPLGESETIDFELAIRAIDLNGNIGPATYTQVAQSADGGCASHHAGHAVSFGMIGIVVGFLVRRRRR